LRRLCAAWIEHRKDVIVRRTRFLLARDEARLHIIEGLIKAIDMIDVVINLIRAAESTEAARHGLMGLGFSERQAEAILDMQLRKLVGLERGKLTAEAAALALAITDYRDILAREARQLSMIREDLVALAAKHHGPRKSELGPPVGDFNMEDLVEDEACVVTITNTGYIKRVAVGTFRLQRRGGKGVSGSNLKADDFITTMFSATNHQYLLFFTNRGRCYWLKVWQVPEADRTARGKHLANVLELEEGEHITATIPVREFREDQFLVMATLQGQIKKTALASYGNPRNGGIKGIKLAEGDVLVEVVITSGNDQLLLATDDGSACRFSETDVRATGRDTGGVTGIELEPGASVVSLLRLDPETEVLTICANGYGKRTPFDEYRLIRRGGKGVTNISTSERNGKVIASLAVHPGDQLMLISRLGQVVRTGVDQIRSTGRTAQGVTIIGLDDGDILTSVARCPADDSDDEAVEPTPA
jgi:DNA gyrase subunit A